MSPLYILQEVVCIFYTKTNFPDCTFVVLFPQWTVAVHQMKSQDKNFQLLLQHYIHLLLFFI